MTDLILWGLTDTDMTLAPIKLGDHSAREANYRLKEGWALQACEPGKSPDRLVAAAHHAGLLAACKIGLEGLHCAFPHADRIRDILWPKIQQLQDAIAKAEAP